MRHLIPALALIAAGSAASAATTTFDTNLLAAFNSDDGIRQVNGAGAVLLPSFDVTADVFAFDLTALGIGGPLDVIKSLAAGLSGTTPNVVVLQDADDDANLATPFNAARAANLIASGLDIDGAGVFVYFNSVLNINRLVLSSNLNSATSDLAILAAIQSPFGAGAIRALPTFTADNFAEVAAVPLPASLPMLAAALAAFGFVRRRSRR